MRYGGTLCLLIERDPHDASIISRAVQETNPGCRVSIAQDADYAVSFLSEHKSPDLLILGLPAPLALGLMQRIKGTRKRGTTPIVVLDGHASDAEVGRAYDLGANSYLSKSGDPDVLYDTACWIARYWLRLDQFGSGPLGLNR